MADNVIQVIIDSQIKGADQLPAYTKSLELLAKQALTSGTSLDQLASTLESINKKFGTAGVDTFKKAFIEAARQAGTEFNKSGGQIVNATDQIARSEQQATKSTNELATAHSVLNTRSLGVSRALGLVASSLADMGPAGQIASNALVQVLVSGAKMASGVALISAGVGILTTVIALLVTHLQQAAKEKEEFDRAMRTGDLDFFLKKIQDADVALGRIEDRLKTLKELQGAEGGLGTSGEEFLFLQNRQQAATSDQQRISTERAKALAEAQKLIGKQLSETTFALDAQTQAVGRI
jgi:hypothetical protein